MTVSDAIKGSAIEFQISRESVVIVVPSEDLIHSLQLIFNGFMSVSSYFARQFYHASSKSRLLCFPAYHEASGICAIFEAYDEIINIPNQIGLKDRYCSVLPGEKISLSAGVERTDRAVFPQSAFLYIVT